jgi:2-hydroxychromene-2-carboxylate isomerase
MGELIRLSERTDAKRRPSGAPRLGRAGSTARTRSRAEFYFDLASPFTYLVAEQLERAFDEVVWTPASAAAVQRTTACADAAGAEAVRVAAEQRAAALRLPLVWPERWPGEVAAAMRLAACAQEAGRGAAFVLAATRLAFCGGFDLNEPDILAEAAAAAGLPLEDCLRGARDFGRDGAVERAGRRLLAVGADRLPALRVGRTLCWGEVPVGEAVAGARRKSGAAR